MERVEVLLVVVDIPAEKSRIFIGFSDSYLRNNTVYCRCIESGKGGTADAEICG